MTRRLRRFVSQWRWTFGTLAACLAVAIAVAVTTGQWWVVPATAASPLAVAVHGMIARR